MIFGLCMFILTEEHNERGLCEGRHEHAYSDWQHPDEGDGSVRQTEGEQIHPDKTSDKDGGAGRGTIADEDLAPAQRLIEFVKCDQGQTSRIDKG